MKHKNPDAPLFRSYNNSNRRNKEVWHTEIVRDQKTNYK